MFQVDFDFIEHRLAIHVNDGRSRSMPLVARSVADFFQEFMASLKSLGIQMKINAHPVEVDDSIPFEADTVHAAYDPVFVNRWWRILLGVSRLLEQSSAKVSVGRVILQPTVDSRNASGSPGEICARLPIASTSDLRNSNTFSASNHLVETVPIKRTAARLET
jgi:hypothetical protein